MPAERWSFWCGPPGGPLESVVHTTLVASEERASFTAAVRHGPDYAVVLVATDLPMPRRGLELRGPGIWADQNVEEPYERWSLGLEAFGVGIDVDPEIDLDVLLARSGAPDLRGDRVPLGWDLEWISTGPVEAEGPTGYRLDCRVEGELLVGDTVAELDAAGGRRHTW